MNNDQIPMPNDQSMTKKENEQKSDAVSFIEDMAIKTLLKSLLFAPAGALWWFLKKARRRETADLATFVKDLLPFDPTSPLDPKKFFLDSCSSCLVWLLGLIIIVVVILGFGGYACTIQDFNWCKAIASLVALFK